MPIKRTLLHSPAVHNGMAAAAAGLLTLAHPGRFPRWARRSVRLARTAGTFGAVYLAAQEQQASPLDVKPVDGRTEVASIGSAVATATSSIGLITSGLGIAADRKVEAFLLRRGVHHPRIWMAVGVASAVLALKTAQELATKHTDFQALAEKQKQAVARATHQDKGGTPATSPAPATATPEDAPRSVGTAAPSHTESATTAAETPASPDGPGTTPGADA